MQISIVFLLHVPVFYSSGVVIYSPSSVSSLPEELTEDQSSMMKIFVTMCRTTNTAKKACKLSNKMK